MKDPRDSTGVKDLALHVSEPSLIPSTTNGPLMLSNMMIILREVLMEMLIQTFS